MVEFGQRLHFSRDFLPSLLTTKHTQNKQDARLLHYTPLWTVTNTDKQQRTILLSAQQQLDTE